MEEKLFKILARLPRRLNDIVRHWSQRSPDKLALVDPHGSWTYQELGRAIENTRIWLIAHGVRPGDRAMIVCENCKSFAAIFFALLEIDAIPVPLNARLSARELEVLQRHCGARRVIYTAGASAYAMDHAQRNDAVIESFSDLGCIGFGPLQENVSPDSVNTDPTKALGAIIYTSGTTGQPKGVMLTHRNLLFAAMVSAEVRMITSEDRLLGVLPLSHATGLSMQFLGTLISGATLYFLPRFDPMKVRSTLEKDRLTILYGVPFLFTQFLEYAKLRRLKSLRFPDLRLMSSSGAPLLPNVKSDVENLFGLVLHNGYGVTECSPLISVTRIGTRHPDTSAGQIYPGVEVKLVGSDQKEVADGGVGEVWVRGPNVMAGYYRAPEETAESLNSEGWFNTRDLAKIQDSNLFIVGRTKELIIRFGFNVYPVEVEDVLQLFPGVVRAAVIGRSSEVTGEQDIVAFVQAALDSHVSSSELEKHAAQYLAPYKRPTEIHLISEMPLTISGKVIKDQLAQRLRDETTVR
jgi:long-chain acyl-CoA synthetase